MRQKTQEQIEKAKERRQKIREIARTLSKKSKEELEAIVSDWPTRIDGHRLSLKNACLIALQGGATVVAGLHDWNKAGRSVRKGEHGKAIFVPLGLRKKPIDGEPLAPDAESPTGYGTAWVFDISQTEERQPAKQREYTPAPSNGRVDVFALAQTSGAMA